MTFLNSIIILLAQLFIKPTFQKTFKNIHRTSSAYRKPNISCFDEKTKKEYSKGQKIIVHFISVVFVFFFC